MSALEVKKLPPANGGCCATDDCFSARAQGVGSLRRPAQFAIFIAGHRVGEFCKRCKTALVEAWESAQSEVRLRVDPFDSVYVIVNPEIIESALWGECIQGRYRVEGEMVEQFGAFRLDRATVLPETTGVKVAA